MISPRYFKGEQNSMSRADGPMQDAFQRVLRTLVDELKWSGDAYECDVVVTMGAQFEIVEAGEWGKPEVRIPATEFPSASDRRKNLHLWNLAVQTIDRVADHLMIERVTLRPRPRQD